MEKVNAIGAFLAVGGIFILAMVGLTPMTGTQNQDLVIMLSKLGTTIFLVGFGFLVDFAVLQAKTKKVEYYITSIIVTSGALYLIWRIWR